jgi:hypothetical protein
VSRRPAVHRTRLYAAALGAALALTGGCSDPVDNAAKARIFSPEDPPRAVSSALEKLPPQDVASDERVARRILGMGAAETTQRLGAHRFTSTVSFEWSSGPRTLKLEESRTLLAGPGGFDGDFHATLENSRDQGMEVLRADGQVYARRRYGKYRHRSRDRGLAEQAREEVFGALRDFDRLFDGRLVLKPQGTATVAGRTTWKYLVSLGPAMKTAAAQNLPPVQFARAGPDSDTRRRLRFFEEREPVTLEGEVYVDADTSVVLKSRLSGTLTAPGEDTGRLSLRLNMTSAITDIGKDPRLVAPAGALPDADKPQGIADALDAFGISRGKDAAAETAPPEPEDEG